MAFFIFLGLAVKATFFEPDPKLKDIASRPHSRLDMYYLACRTLLTVLAIILETMAEKEELEHAKAMWIMTLCCLFTSGSLAFGYIWYIPFYNFKYSILRAAMMCNFFWASLCMLYAALRPDSDVGIIYIIIAPLIYMLAYFLVNVRRKMVEDTRLTAINDPFVLELKVRFRLMEAGLLFKDPASTNITNFERSPGDIVAATATGTQITGAASAEKERAVFEEVNDMFIQGTRQMPKSCMLQLFYGAFQLNYFGNKAQSLAIHTKAAGLAPKLDEAYMIFRRQRLLNERFAGGDVIDFIAFEQNLELARKYERKAHIAVVQFWSELLKRAPSFNRLQLHGAAISSAVSLAQTHYLSLIKLSPDAPHVFRLYGTFLINVLNDPKQGQDLLDHADELEEEQRENNGDFDDGAGGEETSGAITANLDLYSEDNGMVTISGEMSSIGNIVSVNNMALKMFGYKKHEMVGFNISKIVPAPFAESHNHFLAKYLQTGFAKVVDRARQVLGVNREGYLFPFILCVKHVVDPTGKQSFVGVVKTVKESDKSGFMILSQSLHVNHFSRAVARLMGKFPNTPGEETSRETLSSWFPAVTIDRMSDVTSR
ncbi:hypothetical protein HDU76_003829, partial [Blyttiomyces sp. JEL0837]